jgi:hypothetical protein
MAHEGLVPPALYNRTGPMTEQQRLAIKEKLLDVLGRTNIVQVSCQEAGITRATFANWVHNGFITQADLDDAMEVYRDQIRGEISKRMLRGVRKPLLSNGRIVRNEANEPIYLDVPDTKLLIEIAKHVLPEWQEVESKNGVTVNINGASGIPAQYLITLDAREMTPQEFATMKSIVEAVERRKSGVIVIESGI